MPSNVLFIAKTSKYRRTEAKKIENEVKKMKHNNFKKRCWVTNFIYPDGSRGLCIGYGTDICKQCGLCMAGEMASVFNFCPDTLLAGMKLRM